MRIKFTRGIQGSGKSTWAKQWCLDHPDWVRVCRDDIRTMRGQYWLPKDEGMISKMEISLISEAIRNGKNVVVDAMNLNIDRDIKGKMNMLRDVFGGALKYEIIDFTDIPLEECCRRNLIRPNSIDPSVIKKTWDKYLAPEPVVYEEDKSLPHCVIFDVDGTLAKMNGRSPYDWDRVGEDLVNQPVKMLMQSMDYSYRDYKPGKFIIFTGRDGSCMEITKKWLDSNDIPYDDIFIRPKGDTRKDSIIKRELFDNHIRGKYYVDFVVDDRDQVVDMWRREIGLTCLQVDYGNF